MKSILLFLVIALLNSTIRSWEYCQTNLCGKEKHFVCDSKHHILNPTNISVNFLAHVPLTRKVKTAFLNWHNYYRNRTAGGWTKNQIYFPRAVRMRELIWDSELSYLSHFLTKLVTAGEVTCCRTLRFPHVGQNLVVKALHNAKPVLEIIALSLRQMFNEKNRISNPTEISNFLGRNQFITMINDRITRLGCAVALGANCVDEKQNVFEYCYYTACMYNYINEGIIYKIGKPTGRCSHWKVGRSKTYINLCAVSTNISGPEN